MLDESSIQTVTADGEQTSFQSTGGSFNRFILIDQYDSIVGWMHGGTELRVSKNQHA